MWWPSILPSVHVQRAGLGSYHLSCFVSWAYRAFPKVWHIEFSAILLGWYQYGRCCYLGSLTVTTLQLLFIKYIYIYTDIHIYGWSYIAQAEHFVKQWCVQVCYLSNSWRLTMSLSTRCLGNYYRGRDENGIGLEFIAFTAFTDCCIHFEPAAIHKEPIYFAWDTV